MWVDSECVYNSVGEQEIWDKAGVNDRDVHLRDKFYSVLLFVCVFAEVEKVEYSTRIVSNGNAIIIIIGSAVHPATRQFLHDRLRRLAQA